MEQPNQLQETTQHPAQGGDLFPTLQTGMAIVPRDFDEAWRFADMISKSELAPKDFRGKPTNTMAAIMMGLEVGLSPMQAIQNIAVINGRPSLWGDAMLAVCQRHQAYEGIKESFDEATMTATCTVKRVGEEPHTQTFSQKDAELAGLWGKQGPWTQYPKRMIQVRARSFALRDKFADALRGLNSAEEQRDIIELNPTGQAREGDPIPSFAAPGSEGADPAPEEPPQTDPKPKRGKKAVDKPGENSAAVAEGEEQPEMPPLSASDDPVDILPLHAESEQMLKAKGSYFLAHYGLTEAFGKISQDQPHTVRDMVEAERHDIWELNCTAEEKEAIGMLIDHLYAKAESIGYPQHY